LAPLRPPLPLTSVLAGTAPPWCPLSGAVRHLWAALCSSPEPRSSTAPFPRAPIKGSPRAPSSSHQPLPSLSAPSPSTIREAPSSTSSPVSLFPLLPLPLCWSSEKLSEPSSSLTRPRTRSTTSQPCPPPRAHRRRSPPRNPAPSPWVAPSQPSLAELSLPLESPASARAKPPSLGPRTGPQAASRRQAHRRPTPLPRSAGLPRRLAATPFPPALAGKWARCDAVTLTRSTVPPSLLGSRWAVSASARALAPGVGQKPCPQPRKGEISFLFPFPPLFLI
jgi:hypothetical protein